MSIYSQFRVLWESTTYVELTLYSLLATVLYVRPTISNVTSHLTLASVHSHLLIPFNSTSLSQISGPFSRAYFRLASCCALLQRRPASLGVRKSSKIRFAPSPTHFLLSEQAKAATTDMISKVPLSAMVRTPSQSLRQVPFLQSMGPKPM
jgi:hypothetical protein